MRRTVRWILPAVCLCLLLAACAAPARDWPTDGQTIYGYPPQGTLSIFDDTPALAPEGEDAVFWVDRANGGRLLRADRRFADPVCVCEGDVVGLAAEDGALYIARVLTDGEGNARSEILRTDFAGAEPAAILSLDRAVRQLTLADHLLYFIAYDDETSDLCRCSLRGDGLLTVIGGDLPVGDYAVSHNTVWFDTVWTVSHDDTSLFTCGIGGGDPVLTGFRRGGPVFFVGDELFAAVPYGERQFQLEILDREAETDAPYLLEEGGSMVSALWFTDERLYFALPDRLSLYRLDRESREVALLYEEEDGDNCFTGITLAAGRLILTDARGAQYLVDPEAADVVPAPLPTAP